MKVEVVYCPLSAAPEVITLEVDSTCTVKTAVLQSGLLQRYPEWDIQTLKIGIFSRLVTLDSSLQAGDRIEIYRPLLIDPKQARALRATRSRFKEG